MSDESTKTRAGGRQPVVQVRTTEQFDAIASATRFDLLEFLHSIGPCSVAELAEHMATRADRLYHHIRKLVATGFVREVGHRRVGRRSEALFDVAADDFKFDTSVGGEPLLRLLRSVNRRAERVFERAMERKLVDFSGETRTTHLRADTGRLTKNQIQELNTHVAAIIEIFARGREQRDGELYTMSLSLMPFARLHDHDDEQVCPDSKIVESESEN